MAVLSRILVVEDDRIMMESVDVCLTEMGYRVIKATSGEAGLDLALTQKPDLVILDVNLPGLSGFQICRELRRLQFTSPILMLTGRHQVDDRVTGFDAGADDYLPKPFELREFSARIKALLRRGERIAPAPSVLRFGDVLVDLEKRTATRAGEPIGLTKTEFSLLQLLGRKAGEVVTRETILDVVWGYARYPTTRTIDTHIWRLRKKIGDDAANPRWLKQLHGQGYCLTTDDMESSPTPG